MKTLYRIPVPDLEGYVAHAHHSSIALGGARRAFVQADLSPLLLGASFEVVVVRMFRHFCVVPTMRRGFFVCFHHVVKRWLIMVISHVFPYPFCP